MKILLSHLNFFLFEYVDKLGSFENFRQLIGHVDRSVRVFVRKKQHIVWSEKLTNSAIVSFLELNISKISKALF